jgi:superfamily II DNA or RNA helicase
MSGLVLREYQSECVAAVRAAEARGVQKMLAVLPTGGGKTVIFGHLISETVSAGGTALVLAHRDELLSQAREKLVAIEPSLELATGLVKAGSNDVNAQVVVASVQTLARQSRLDQLPSDFDLIVVDEGHHATADSYQRVMDHVSGTILLVTATPERADGKSLESIVDEMVFARSIEWMVDQGYLCPPRGKRISVDVDLSKVKKSHGDFQADDLAEALENADALDDILATYVEHGEDRKTLIFCPTVAMAHHTAAVFRDAGLAAEAVDGTTPEDERHGILHRLHTGETKIVANVGVLTEGFDEPSIGCIIIASPTKSRVKYTQIVGRGLRLYPGKQDCLILDVVGASDDLSIQSLPALFGLASLLDDEDVIEGREREAKEAAEREEAEAQEQGTEHDDRRRRNAESIQFFGRGRMNWTTIDDKWTIPVDTFRTLVLWPIAGEHFDVLLLNEDKETFKFLARGLDLGYAQGAAEETIRKHGNRLLADSKAAWREDKVTPGQRRYLKRLRLDVPPTKGEAADAITEANVTGLLERVGKAIDAHDGPTGDRELERAGV